MYYHGTPYSDINTPSEADSGRKATIERGGQGVGAWVEIWALALAKQA